MYAPSGPLRLRRSIMIEDWIELPSIQSSIHPEIVCLWFRLTFATIQSVVWAIPSTIHQMEVNEGGIGRGHLIILFFPASSAYYFLFFFLFPAVQIFIPDPFYSFEPLFLCFGKEREREKERVKEKKESCIESTSQSFVSHFSSISLLILIQSIIAEKTEG